MRSDPQYFDDLKVSVNSFELICLVMCIVFATGIMIVARRNTNAIINAMTMIGSLRIAVKLEYSLFLVRRHIDRSISFGP